MTDLDTTIIDVEPEPSLRARLQDRGGAALQSVYDHLIDGEDDTVGMIAYALYKREKRDWLENWRRRNGSPPNAEQLSTFMSANMTAGQRQRYRAAAEHVAVAAGTQAAGEPGPGGGGFGALNAAFAERIEAAAQTVERSTSLRRQALAGLVGAVAALVLLALLSWLLASQGPLLSRLFGLD